MKAVLDAGVVFSGAGWRSESHLCLVALARRRVQAFATAATLAELQGLVSRKQRLFPRPSAALTILEWYYSAVSVVLPAPLGKGRSRDAKDDPYLAAALSAQAGCIVSRDEDLLALGKPFGVSILTPRAFLNRLHHPAV